MAAITLPSEREMDAAIKMFREPWPVGYRHWCRTAKVPVRGKGMVPWQPEVWHAVQDAAMARGQDIFVLKAKDRHWTTDHILRLLWLGMWCEERSGLFLTVNEDEAYKSPDSFKERMRLMWLALPAWQRWMSPLIDCPEGSFGTGGDLQWSHAKWLSQGEGLSWLMIRPATANAGATGAYTDCVMDELGRYELADATFASAMESTHRTGGNVLAGGTLTITSSPATRLWQEYLLAQLPDADSSGLFFGYGSKRGETPERYAVMEEKARRRGAAGLLELHRLYPRTAEEAMEAFGKGLCSQEALRDGRLSKEPLPVPDGLKALAML